MKAGGSYRLPSNRAFTYWIQPTFPRFDYNKPIDGKCECYTKGQGGVHQDCRIWGRGWKGVSSDNGQGFKDNTKGCYKVSLPGPTSLPRQAIHARIIELTSLVVEHLEL